MNTAASVDELVKQLKESGKVLSDVVWATALSCVGWPYVFGAWGEECTPAGRRRRYRDDHPTIKTKCKNFDGKGTCDGCQWYPRGCRVRMFDCRGFTDWCLKQFGIDLQGEGATSQWNTASNWAAKGTIDTIPNDVLVCLFVHNDKTGKKEHTGLGYRGETVECSSGVQYFEKRNKKWTHWAMPRGISGEVPEPAPAPTPGAVKPTLRKGSRGSYVTELQLDLVKLGYNLGTYGTNHDGVDGSFGAKTEDAVKAFQKSKGLAADGVVGPNTWAALDQAVGDEPVPEPEPEKFYTVTIAQLTKEKALALTAEYPWATMTEEG